MSSSRTLLWANKVMVGRCSINLCFHGDYWLTISKTLWVIANIIKWKNWLSLSLFTCPCPPSHPKTYIWDNSWNQCVERSCPHQKWDVSKRHNVLARWPVQIETHDKSRLLPLLLQIHVTTVTHLTGLRINPSILWVIDPRQRPMVGG